MSDIKRLIKLVGFSKFLDGLLNLLLSGGRDRVSLSSASAIKSIEERTKVGEEFVQGVEDTPS